MPSALLNVVVPPRRMLGLREAADYCARPRNRFLAECPVQPVRFANGDERYDMHDLDAWIDGLKADHAVDSADAIVARLG